MIRTHADIRPRTAALLMLLIVAIGLTLRLWGINFDEGLGMQPHPDERSTACNYAPAIALPATWEEFTDPHKSPLNPLWDRFRQERRSFTYGHFPLYLGVAMGEGLHRLAPTAETIGAPTVVVDLMAKANQPCMGVAVAGRLVIALLDTLTVVLLYFLGKRLHGRGAGVLAAALYAFTAQAVQLAHFFAMDPASTTFTVLAVLGALIMVQDRSWKGVIVTGIGMGLAVASKFSAIPILAAPIVAAFCILYDENRKAHAEQRPPDGHAQMIALGGAAIAILIGVIAFFVTSPYAVLDWENFLQATLIDQGQMVRGIADMPFTRQYRNTWPYFYFIEQQVRWGMGPVLGGVALLGVTWALARLALTLVQLVRGRVVASDRMGELLLWAWLFPYFGLTGAFLAKFNRYMSPVLPFVLLFAAGMVVWLILRAQMWMRVLGWLLLVVSVAGGLFWSVAYVNGVYTREHTWHEASAWMYENIPAGSTVLWELWDDPLPQDLPVLGLNRGVAGITNIDWSPYEEDTAEKYALMKEKLRQADYVAYSSKRIYDSVDELPARYPMTNLYYDAMWDGRLGFELAYEATTSPRLFGFVFDDRDADESWSLYDHPQATIFRKVRDLSDAEFDALFDHIYENAVPWDRGEGTPLDPLIDMVGLGDSQSSQEHGLVSRAIALVTGQDRGGSAKAIDPDALMIDRPLRDLPVVDDYRWNSGAAATPWLAVATWWGATLLLAIAAWPLAFFVFRPLRDRGWFFARALGWLLAGWSLWLAASGQFAIFSVRNVWTTVGVLAAAGIVAAIAQRKSIGAFLRERWQALLLGEAIFGAAFLLFVGIRIMNPDLWQPWQGGEKFMEVAFINGILRSPYFPPVDPHFAGGFINYYYFGMYLVAFLYKMTGIPAEIGFNLAIPLLFALTATHAYGIAYSAVPEHWRTQGWQRGAGYALFAPLFITLVGNLDGFAMVVRNLGNYSASHFESAIPGVQALVRAASALDNLGAVLKNYNFWEPSRVIPATINEFPFWSFLFADLHPHLIGIPISLVFCALVLVLVRSGGRNWLESRLFGAALLATFSLVLGTLASVNLWELPTYFGLGILALVVSQYWGRGRVSLWWTVAFGSFYAVLAWLFFLPFFANYTNIGASGVGFVREGDEVGRWLLIWGLPLFVTASWLLWSAGRAARPVWRDGVKVRPDGFERAFSLAARKFDRLPRIAWLERVVQVNGSFAYRMIATLLPLTLVGMALAWWLDRSVLALCLPLLTLSFVLLWRRGSAADAGTQVAVLLAVTGFAILAGTQVVYLKDFLSGGDYYRMNTLFKFFNQVWVLLGITAAVGFARLWSGWMDGELQSESDPAPVTRSGQIGRWVWTGAFALLLTASLFFPLFGTMSRVDDRLVGWRPERNTLDGLAYMNQGVYSWPDASNTIELQYDRPAIDWLLDHVRGNVVIAETSELDYYRAGSTRAASQTGLSGLGGFHEGEQRYGETIGARAALHQELWRTQSVFRMQEILDDLDVALVYAGQLENYLHPDAMGRLQNLAEMGYLTPVYMNERTIIYLVAGRMKQDDQGDWWPVPTTAVATLDNVTTPATDLEAQPEVQPESQLDPQPEFQPDSPIGGGG